MSIRERDESTDPHGGWPAPERVGLTFSDPDDPDGAHAEYVRADLHRGAVDTLREIRDEAVTMGRAWHVADRALKALGVPSPNAERGQ